MKQKCSNTFSLVALVNVIILVTTVLYIIHRVYYNYYMIEKKQNHQRMPAEFHIFSLYEGM